MKNSLLILFILILFNSNGQSNWVKGNPVWHYSFQNVGESGFIRIDKTSDTLLLGKICDVLTAVKHSFFYTGPDGTMGSTTGFYEDRIVYFENDTLFLWEVDHFNVLFDFTATVGDSWIIGTNSFGFGCEDTSRINVAQQSTILLNGINYNEWTVEPDSLNSVGIYGKVNARFGPTNNYLFPTGRSCDMTPVEFDMISFTCFEDDSLYYNPTGEACEYFLGLTENKKNDISVFPNPSAGKFEFVSAIPLHKITVVNLVGEKVKEVKVNFSSQKLDLSELPQGNYYVHFENINGESFVKSIQILPK